MHGNFQGKSGSPLVEHGVQTSVTISVTISITVFCTVTTGGTPF